MTLWFYAWYFKKILQNRRPGRTKCLVICTQNLASISWEGFRVRVRVRVLGFHPPMNMRLNFGYISPSILYAGASILKNFFKIWSVESQSHSRARPYENCLRNLHFQNNPFILGDFLIIFKNPLFSAGCTCILGVSRECLVTRVSFQKLQIDALLFTTFDGDFK